MKKIITISIALLILLTGCDSDNANNDNNNTTDKTKLRIKNESSYEIVDALWQNISFTDLNNDADKYAGTWYSDNIPELIITRTNNNGGSWTMIANQPDTLMGTWVLDSDEMITLTTVSRDAWKAMFSNNRLIVSFTTGKPQSLGELNTVTFRNMNLNNVIKPGNSVIKNVEVNSGYIYFRMYPWGTRAYASPFWANYVFINVRTNDLVISEKDESMEFIFTNNTLVVDVDDPGNTGTLNTILAAYEDPIKDHDNKDHDKKEIK